MKISTITCHNVYNHGASLQAYALMKHLMKIGHDVEIIDYKPDYLTNPYRMFNISNPAWSKNFLTKFVYYIVKVPGRIPALKRKRSFDRFTQQYLKITNTGYTSNDALKKATPEADAYICGSDQIWNSLHKNGRDPAFYLDFAPESKIKLAYAASFATDTIADEFKPFVKEKVQKLDGVGVREISGVKILHDLDIEEALPVVDPVFLLGTDDWDQVGNLKFNEKFILIYDFDKSALIERLARQIARLKGYKIYSISPWKIKYADKSFHYDGPQTFVSLVRNAEYVISNSFHAVVFSLIYKKNLIAVNRTENINTRMRDLLEEINLGGRLVHSNPNLKELLADINYDVPEKILNQKIGFSKKYLQQTLAITK